MQVFGFIYLCTVCYLASVSAQFFQPFSGGCPPFMCPLQCPNGYAVNSNGCKICQCLTSGGSGANINSVNSASVMNPGGDPFHQGGAQMSIGGVTHSNPTSLTYHKPCINDTTCILKCSNGYYNGPDGCQFCLCAAIQTANPTSSSAYNNPCPGSAQSCDMVCINGYETESSGCQHCKCTLSPDTGTTVPPPVSTTLSEGECLQKITECQLKYPFGFMTDDSCVMCISKDEIYPPIITEEHQPMIRLTNPCIQGLDICRIFCATGYRRGPRSCQYCACNG